MIDTVWVDSVRGVLLLFLAILANFLGVSMNCSLQKNMTHHPLWRNIAIYLIIYFTINFTSQSVIHPFHLFGYAFIVYVLYLLLVRQSIYGISIGLVCIFTIFVASQFIIYYERRMVGADPQNIKKYKHWIYIANRFIHITSILLLICLIVGFVLYFVKQMKDHPDFDPVVFILGTNKCGSKTTKL